MSAFLSKPKNLRIRDTVVLAKPTYCINAIILFVIINQARALPPEEVGADHHKQGSESEEGTDTDIEVGPSQGEETVTNGRLRVALGVGPLLRFHEGIPGVQTRFFLGWQVGEFVVFDGQFWGTIVPHPEPRFFLLLFSVQGGIMVYPWGLNSVVEPLIGLHVGYMRYSEHKKHSEWYSYHWMHGINIAETIGIDFRVHDNWRIGAETTLNTPVVVLRCEGSFGDVHHCSKPDDWSFAKVFSMGLNAVVTAVF
jgi:hypothetical protein